MSVQSAREFLMKVKNDKSLEQRLEGALAKSDNKRAALIAFAAAEGFKFEEADLVAAHGSNELSEQALDAVAGGGAGSAGLYSFNPQPEPPGAGPGELGQVSRDGQKGSIVR